MVLFILIHPFKQLSHGGLLHYDDDSLTDGANAFSSGLQLVPHYLWSLTLLRKAMHL